MINSIEVGGTFPLIAGREEGVIFETDASGFLLIYNLNSPTDKEIAAMKSEQPFEIRSVSFGGICWVLSKCGNLAWTDAPYTPHLSAGAKDLQRPNTGLGIALTLLMVDAATNIVKSIRLIGLGERFSLGIYNDIQELLSQPFEREQYFRSVKIAQIAHTTKELVQLASNRYKLRAEP